MILRKLHFFFQDNKTVLWILLANALVLIFILQWISLYKKQFVDQHLLNTVQIPLHEREFVDISIIQKYGISIDNVMDALSLGSKIYFVDVQEPEEFQLSHLKQAKNIRSADLSYTKIQGLFHLNEKAMMESFFIVYCRYSYRSSEIVKTLNKKNIKFLIGGIEGGDKNRYKDFYSKMYQNTGILFSDKIRRRNFDLDFKELKKWDKKDIFFVDTRLHTMIPLGLSFRIGQLTSLEYEEKLKLLLEQKGKKILFIAESYPDLFYAKLLIQRLYQDYDFPLGSFYIAYKKSLILQAYINEKE